ncbi:altered inheritance of mitochondria protein 21 [Thelonectria olida]|uniref:Altered inheritance of mitochondria protein 21 n=1 Tax=Thelonectria olida TaxID=1576542 RepID=A0A9P8WLR2_9HYPO|nr:altered inheritance of mitochondria protein 21 [Thelonectria olida]
MAATMQQTPVIPPRPSRNQDKGDSSSSTSSLPKVPPRPASKRLTDRSISPNPDRFAPSPLSAGIPLKSPKSIRFSDHNGSSESIERPGSVSMPSLGEEGREYSAMTEEFEGEKKPEQTSTVAHDLKLHAPKPSLPAQSATQRVQAVTRTDSERAASYGIGRPTSSEGIKKKASTSFSATESQPGDEEEDEHGIPEIGQRVPMNPHLGDVQAPSPAPGSEEFRHHHRRHSSRGGPPGSYGLHGHGVAPQDKLDKQYYEKNPHIYDRENKTPLHDRQNDFAMSSNDLNKLVRDTPSRAGGGKPEYHATPTDEVGFQASEEYASRISSPRSADAEKQRGLSFKSEITGPDGEKTVHVDDPEHPQYRSPGDIETAVDDEDNEYVAPILASDEVSKDNKRYKQQPAVHPPLERRGSANEMEEPTSQPSSRPTSIYKENYSQEFSSTPLEDVKEYEPLFSEEAKKEEQKRSEGNKARHYFPSKDVWEDAPNSVHYTAEVSTPDVNEKPRTLSGGPEDRPKTPAHLFAQRQEELAEQEIQGPQDVKTSRSQEKQIWAPQPESDSFLAKKRPAPSQRFPSRDVWEDVPESQLYETTVSSEQQEESKQEESKPEVSSQKPAIPERPKPKQTPSDEAVKTRPPVSDKPKPQIPPRPAKSSPGASEAAKAKPPVPSRPVGGKIAALQAGFMSDLNKRLQIGPQAPKKEEPKPQEDLTEEKEKAPLSDARKGRARGPQRRAPAKSPAAPEPSKTSAVSLSFSIPQTLWSVDPDSGSLAVVGEDTPAPVVEQEEKVEPVKEEAEVKVEEPIQEPVQEHIPEPVAELVEEPVEKPTEKPIEQPVDEPKVETLEETKPIEEKTEAPDKEEPEVKLVEPPKVEPAEVPEEPKV